MDNVLRLAEHMYLGQEHEKFLMWLRLQIAETEIASKDFYSTGEVFPMLGHSQRVYQVWEKDVDFPLREPHRIGTNRAYRPQDVVAIAFWRWRRKDKRKRKEVSEDN